jgi:hypothetical protein
MVTGPDGRASRVVSVAIDNAGALALTLEDGAVLTPAQIRSVAHPPGDTP